MSAHVLDSQPSLADRLAAKTPVEGFAYLTSSIEGHEFFWRDFERTFFGTMLEAIPSEKRKELILVLLEHEQAFKRGIRELLFHTERLAALTGVELPKCPFERSL